MTPLRIRFGELSVDGFLECGGVVINGFSATGKTYIANCLKRLSMLGPEIINSCISYSVPIEAVCIIDYTTRDPLNDMRTVNNALVVIDNFNIVIENHPEIVDITKEQRTLHFIIFARGTISRYFAFRPAALHFGKDGVFRFE